MGFSTTTILHTQYLHHTHLVQVKGIPTPSWSHTWTWTHVGMTPGPMCTGLIMGIMGIVQVTGEITGLTPILTFLGFI
jgi:hypothetical protein